MEEEINIKELFTVLRKGKWIIIGLLILSMVLGGIFSFLILDKEYETFTTLMVGKPQDYQSDKTLEYNDLMLNQKLVSTYGELIKTRAVSDKVIENLNLQISYGEFASKVSVSLVQNTEIIKIQVTDNNPTLAAAIANETAEVFMDTVKEVMRVENVQVIDPAQVPTGPVSPRPMLNIAIAGLVGLIIGVLIVFLKDYLDNSIKTQEDVEKYLGLPVLGNIPLVEE